MRLPNPQWSTGSQTRSLAWVHPWACWAASRSPFALSGPQFPLPVSCVGDQSPCQLFCPRTDPLPPPREVRRRGRGGLPWCMKLLLHKPTPSATASSRVWQSPWNGTKRDGIRRTGTREAVRGWGKARNHPERGGSTRAGIRV